MGLFDVLFARTLESETTFDRIKRLYIEGRLTAAGVRKAVRLKMITQAQCDEILASK